MMLDNPLMGINDERTDRTQVNESDLQTKVAIRLAWTIGLTITSVFFGGSVTRSIPGGPFISNTGNILPFLFSCAAITIGFPCLRAQNAAPKLYAIIFILIATVALAANLEDVYIFWSRPSARGRLIGY